MAQSAAEKWSLERTGRTLTDDAAKAADAPGWRQRLRRRIAFERRLPDFDRDAVEWSSAWNDELAERGLTLR